MTSTGVIGVDIGGTNIRAGLFVDGHAEHFVTRSASLQPGELPADAMAELLSHAAEGDSSRYAAVGMSITSPVDRTTRLISNPFTLPDWSGIPWITELEQTIGRPIVVDNDAMGAAIGEFQHGAGREADVMCMVTLGTGIGVATVTRNGGPVRGAQGAHPEAGHIVIASTSERCYCNEIGCFEELCSGPGIARYWQASDGTINWNEYGSTLARGIRNLSRVYAPDRVVFGGGVSDNFDDFAPALTRAFAQPDPMGVPTPAFVRAQLEQPGATGAAWLAAQAVGL